MIHVLGLNIDVVKLLVAWAVLSVLLGLAWVALHEVHYLLADRRRKRFERRQDRQGRRTL